MTADVSDAAGNAVIRLHHLLLHMMLLREPTVSSAAMSDSALKSGETATLTITFSEAVTAFATATQSAHAEQVGHFEKEIEELRVKLKKAEAIETSLIAEQLATSVQEEQQRMTVADTERERLSKAHSDLMEEVKGLRKHAASMEEKYRTAEAQHAAIKGNSFHKALQVQLTEGHARARGEIENLQNKLKITEAKERHAAFEARANAAAAQAKSKAVADRLQKSMEDEKRKVAESRQKWKAMVAAYAELMDEE